MSGGILSTFVWTALVAQSIPTEGGLKVAFMGDSGAGVSGRKVFNLVKSEGAHLVIHEGDFDYENDPDAFESAINDTLGEEFPFFAVVGNHDLLKWKTYQKNFQARLKKNPEAKCYGDLGVKSYCTYRGLFFLLSGVGTKGWLGHHRYIEKTLESSNHRWRICAWHKNQRLMQVGGKGDGTGWTPYELCRKNGAIIVTGHEHSYARSHLLKKMEQPEIVHTNSLLEIGLGQTFAAVVGTGGRAIRPAKDKLDQNPWWASVYTKDQNAKHGALFCTFADSSPDHASCYFKNVENEMIDEFQLLSTH